MEPHLSIWGDFAGVELRQHFVNAAGIRTRIVEAGSGPTLVMVHGTGGHLEAYTRNVRELSQHFRLVLFDMVGHGLSEKPNRPYLIDYLSDHLVAVLDVLGIERAHLSGESLGGWVAAWTAAHHPDRVDRLVLNTPGNITNNPKVMAGLKASSLAAVRDSTYETVRARVEWLFGDKSLVTDELIRFRQRLYQQEGFERAMENILAVQDWEHRAPYIWTAEWCGMITAPTLLLWTDKDPTATVEDAEILLKLIPGSTLEVIKGAGHWPQWEKPEEFNSMHVQFLEG
ncbi:alpha/beta fold hydrolase [Microbacterium sp. NPDC077644]|jgi:2-hydroxy-6-oxonona-2,4-dienedioate hydrolase|uniref:alpha/beta fold hydrolase n=1 Tax=Microbacterium sp. NPDC077644 TaxID=3155055 RepID=UPI00344B6EF2